jgi:hypothetical protein
MNIAFFWVLLFKMNDMILWKYTYTAIITISSNGKCEIERRRINFDLHASAIRSTLW